MFQMFALAVGVALLTFGRRLFWLAVGSLGFVLAFTVVREVAGDGDPRLVLALGALGGALGAVLAVALQRIAIVMAGFLLGALATASFLPAIGSFSDPQALLLAAGGGILGGVLSLSVVSLALRLVTAAVGSLLILQAVGLPAVWARILFVVLWGLGFLAQGRATPR